MPKKSHKQRAKELLEAHGWTVADVEQHTRHSFTTIDLFNFADLLAVKPGVGCLLLQVTSTSKGKSGGHVGERLAKCLAEPKVAICLKSSLQIEVWGVRDQPAKDGSLVLARSLELSEDGQRVIAFEGSEVLGI